MDSIRQTGMERSITALLAIRDSGCMGTRKGCYVQQSQSPPTSLRMCSSRC